MEEVYAAFSGFSNYSEEFFFFLDLLIVLCYNNLDMAAIEHLYLKDGGQGMPAALVRALGLWEIA